VTIKYLLRRFDVHSLDADWDDVACEHPPPHGLAMDKKVMYVLTRGFPCMRGIGMNGPMSSKALPLREVDGR
jgi:hypothetical protein